MRNSSTAFTSVWGSLMPANKEGGALGPDRARPPKPRSRKPRRSGDHRLAVPLWHSFSRMSEWLRHRNNHATGHKRRLPQDSCVRKSFRHSSLSMLRLGMCNNADVKTVIPNIFRTLRNKEEFLDVCSSRSVHCAHSPSPRKTANNF
jgi:hypothetical protein